MKFDDLAIRHIPDVWQYTPPSNPRGKAWVELEDEARQFDKMRSDVRENIMLNVDNAMNRSETPAEVGKNIDEVLEILSKSYFCPNDAVDGDLLLKKANTNTLNKKLQSWCEQLVKNVPTIRKSLGAHIFFDKLPNVPAVIVCAGPSLGNSIEGLRKLKGKALIVSTDTAFRSLIKRGIEPDIVNAHDANDNGARFFQGIDTKSIAFFVNYISPLTIEAYKGPKVYYYVSDIALPVYQLMAHACDWPGRLDGSFLQAGITGGSSVAHTALYVALRLGCNPITFVGLDLSYPDLKKSHFETDNPKNVADQKLIDVWSINNQKVKTNLSFYSYKVVMERMAPYIQIMQNKELFTSTENEKDEVVGVVHAGLRPMHLGEFSEKFASQERDEIKKLEGVLKSYGNY